MRVGDHAAPRLLIPNARNAQAYAVIRSLRPRATRIVALSERRWPGEAYLAHAVFSPGVDRWRSTPWPGGDWERAGPSSVNTRAEARYLETVEDACREERITCAYPSVESTIYVLAKNRERLAKHGVCVVGPPIETVRLVNDKYESLVQLAAAEVPVPQTRLPAPDELPRVAAELGVPVVVKPRYASASRGVHVTDTPAALRTAYHRVAATYGRPLVQEYVPGPLDGGFLRVIGVADADSRVLGLQVCRTLLTLFADSVLPPAVARSEANPEVAGLVARIVRALGVQGAFLVQFKIDARDGRPKLIEVNCKLSYRVWTAMAEGLDVPGLAFDVAHGRTVRTAGPCRTGTLFVNPVELGAVRWLDPRRAGRVATALREGPRVCDPYAAGLREHPRVSLLWWTTFLGFALKEQVARRLARRPWGRR
jgi:carbamoyl-phosphate synthase large subunit